MRGIFISMLLASMLTTGTFAQACPVPITDEVALSYRGLVRYGGSGKDAGYRYNKRPFVSRSDMEKAAANGIPLIYRFASSDGQSTGLITHQMKIFDYGPHYLKAKVAHKMTGQVRVIKAEKGDTCRNEWQLQ